MSRSVVMDGTEEVKQHVRSASDRILRQGASAVHRLPKKLAALVDLGQKIRIVGCDPEADSRLIMNSKARRIRPCISRQSHAQARLSSRCRAHPLRVKLLLARAFEMTCIKIVRRNAKRNSTKRTFRGTSSLFELKPDFWMRNSSRKHPWPAKITPVLASPRQCDLWRHETSTRNSGGRLPKGLYQHTGWTGN